MPQQPANNRSRTTTSSRARGGAAGRQRWPVVVLTLGLWWGSLVSADAGTHGLAGAEARLAASEPRLAKLYRQYPGYHAQLVAYAHTQGFVSPIETVATVMHELVHLDSYAHQGYYVDGIYYEPYLSATAWPSLTNADVADRVAAVERGPVFYLYIRKTPANHLGNIVDELNAYGHVAAFVCRNELRSAVKQTMNLAAFLRVAGVYLHTLRIEHPAEYAALAARQASRGILLLVMRRAESALQACGVASPADARGEREQLEQASGSR